MNDKDPKLTASDAPDTATQIENPRTDKKAILLDLGSVKLETRGSYGGFGDHPSMGNDRPPIGY